MAAASLTPFFGIRDEDHIQMKQQQQQQQQPCSNPAVAAAAAPQSTVAHVKKKRNLPGNPNPDDEVIALSPKTLMATNRFICEVCNKGFQREQNLQLHRRGHNLPWKLKQKSTKEVRRRVYLCPEPTCIHHDPSRALGDLTGIKKHFSRKHGEKKWKCNKCSKKYAVLSDWKAHSKTCGTREYRCDCGTLFSRRDSFTTHRAFCDALGQESVRLPTTLGNHLYGSNTTTMSLALSQLSSLQGPTNHPSPSDLLSIGGTHLRPPSNPSSGTFYLASGRSNNSFQEFNNDQPKPFHGLMQLPDQLQSNTRSSSSSPASFNLSFFSNSSSTSNNINNNEPAAFFSGTLMNDHHLYNSSIQNQELVLPQMSATALLQKAAQIGMTTSSNSSGSSLLNDSHLQGLMNSLANGNAGMFGGGSRHEQQEAGFGGFSAGLGLSNADSRLTRDFLGVGSMVRISQREQMDSFDSELKLAVASARSFAGGSLQ